MIQLLKPGGDCLTETTLEEMRESKHGATEAFWIDLLNPEPEEEQFIEKTLSVNIPSRDEMHELAASSRLFAEDGTIYLSCWVLSFESPIPINTSVAFVVMEKQFVSIRYSDHHAFRIFKNAGSRLQSRRFRHSNDALVELIEAIVGHIASMLRLVEQDLNSLSVEIFSEQHSQRKQLKKLGLKRMVQRLGKQNSLIACLRESSVSLSGLTSYFLEHGEGQLQPGVTARLKTVEQDIGSLRQYDANRRAHQL
jgi:magnesium transporter